MTNGAILQSEKFRFVIFLTWYQQTNEIFSFGTRSEKQTKTFLKNLHFLEGLFRFPVNISSVSLVEVRSDKTQTLKGLLSNSHDFSSQRKTLMVFLCKSFKRYRGIIRTDCDYRKQSIPSGVGTPPLFQRRKK